MNHHQRTIDHNKQERRLIPPTSQRPSASSSALLASFDALPTTVQKMMEERGIQTPIELRCTAAFMRFIEQNLDPATLRKVADPKGDFPGVLSAVQGSLRSRSAEAMAIHLYTKELLRLLSVAAARQHLAAARNR
jgi:hypothetical protein